jgi:hypothetical protein
MTNNFFFFLKERHSKLSRKKVGKKWQFFAKFNYLVLGFKVVKMAQNFTFSCFSCISKDIVVRRNFLKYFLAAIAALYLTMSVGLSVSNEFQRFNS